MPAGSLIVHRLLLLAALEGVVVQQLLDEVNVGEQHSSAAVPAKPVAQLTSPSPATVLLSAFAMV